MPGFVSTLGQAPSLKSQSTLAGNNLLGVVIQRPGKGSIWNTSKVQNLFTIQFKTPSHELSFPGRKNHQTIGSILGLSIPWTKNR